MKKVEKTTRLSRYDLSQIPYNYTVTVTNRSKRLDLSYTECLKNYGQKFKTVQEAVTKIILKKRNAIRQCGYVRRI